MPLYNRLFLSSSNIISYVNSGDGLRYYGIPKSAYNSTPNVDTDHSVSSSCDTFVWLNNHIYETITGSSNILGFPLDMSWDEFENTAYNRSYCNGGFHASPLINVSYFNTLMNKRNGSYQFPSWKQIRNHDHPLVKWQRENNIISIMENSQQKIVISNGRRLSIIPKRSGIITHYFESPIIGKYKPMIIELGEGKYLNSSLVIQAPFGNINSNFSNMELNNKLGLSKGGDTLYDRIKQLYLGEEEENRIVDNVKSIIIGEYIYPQESNTFLQRTRKRNLFYFPWKDNRNERNRTNVTNSQGYVIENQSIWGMDARLNYSTVDPLTGSIYGQGELQNSYTQFFGEDKYIVDPNLPGNYVRNVFNFNPSGKPGFGIGKKVNIVSEDIGSGRTNYYNYNDFESAVICPWRWNEEIINTSQAFTISTWIYLPNIDNIVNLQPARQTIASFGTSSFSLYLTTGSHIPLGGLYSDTYSKIYDQKARGLAFSASYAGAGGTKHGCIYQTIEGSEQFYVEKWHHVAVVFNNANNLAEKCTLYVDGVDITSSITHRVQNQEALGNNLSPIDPNRFIIGSSSYICGFNSALPQYQDPAPFFGYISNLSIFGKALTSAEISILYNGGYPKSLYTLPQTVAGNAMTGSLISWWPLGDGIGIITGSGKTILGQNVFGGAKVCVDNITSSVEYFPNNPNLSIAFDMASFNHGFTTQSNSTKGNNYVISPFTKQSPERPLYAESSKDRFNLDLGCDNFKVGALYSRGHYIYTGSFNWITMSLSSSISFVDRKIRVTASRKYIGETQWTINESASNPFFNKYEDQNDVIFYGFKDYSLIPEFRISERIDYYLENGMNFLKDDNTFLSLTGSEYKDSGEDNFYKYFSNSEFMKNFEVVKSDYKDVLEENNFTLKCKGILKLLPYEGFYPMQRTLQLAKIFSQSYGDNVKSFYTISGSEVTASWRSFLTPFFAPGIIYNSIKAGMAVDYPIYTSYPTIREDFIQWTGSYDFVSGGYGIQTTYINVTGPFNLLEESGSIILRGVYGFPYYASASSYYADWLGYLFPINRTSSFWFGTKPDELDRSLEWQSVLNKDFSKRLPFVSIIEPENYISKQTIYDIEPDYSASLRQRFSIPETTQGTIWNGNSKVNYKLAMHNFLAEVPNFFLKEGKMTSFVSNPISKEGINIEDKDANSYFGMDVVVSNGSIQSLTDWNRRRNINDFGDIYNITSSFNKSQIENICDIHTQMYNRDSAFGPPWVYNGDLFTSGERMESYHFGYEPFTPAYFNGFGLARILFYPFKGAGTYTLDEIQSHLEIKYIRMPTYREGSMALNKIDRLLEWSTISAMDKNLFVSKSINFGGRLDNGIEKYRSSYDIVKQINSATSNWQQIKDSIDLVGKSKVKSVTFEKGFVNDFEPISISDTELDSKLVWTISPKWETPIFNFKNANVSSSAFYETSSRGMWHQYGNFCEGKEGIYLNVQDLPNQVICSVEHDLSGTIHGTPFKKRMENIYELEKENAYIDLYIREYTLLADHTLAIDWSAIRGGTVASPSQGIYRAEVSNFVTAQNIAESINNCISNWSYKSGYHFLNGEPEGYFTDISNKYTDIGVPIANRFEAYAYAPIEHPWLGDDTLTGSKTVAAVRIKVRDIATSASFYFAASEGNKSLSRFYKGLNYPNYYKSGEEGNSIFVSIGEAGGKIGFNNIWLLRGARASYRIDPSTGYLDAFDDNTIYKEIPRINDIVFDSCAYFHGGKDNKYEVKSLADLMGFQKVKKRMGEVEDEKVIKEAIVAIPFIEEKGKKKFFSISRREIDLALGNKKPIENEKLPGKSIIDMTQKMKDYVIPPKFDFINNSSIKPYALYLFEFKHILTKDDLRAIWQNVMPEISTSFETSESTISHPLLSNEFFRGTMKDKIRWMVFKVKQKAKINYYETTLDQSDDDRFKFSFDIGGKKTNIIPQYSYNWPYDYFSLVELAKLEAEVKFDKKK
jgi:hypothetical protein